ncbi:MAG: cobalamin biosynthesis protein CobQ [Richelia sp. RM2_1_2]|nr:cobalamin biosynthesis protein CobQ [Richelia sp. SM1_7_0]NJN11394.1 cobalamin biosynthesis protein CobQ [Richelia sp. RM1_1_1]NJO28893.1 cobalamin biosynthesis protein CobQ [Richelia sp. SL_2_1]NJO62711.1 cobalamin biosynthesis protein CobQ [Richelia sp. RM2_1_2]
MVAKRYKRKRSNKNNNSDTCSNKFCSYSSNPLTKIQISPDNLQNIQSQTDKLTINGTAKNDYSESNIDAESTVFYELKTNEKIDRIEDWGTELNDGLISDEQDSISIANKALYQDDTHNGASKKLLQIEDVRESDFSSKNNQVLEENLISNENDNSYQNREELIKSSTTIHIVDGEKGGAGKSLFSRTLIEYCDCTGLDMAIVDADTSNQDIAKIYNDVDIAFFSDDENLAQKADFIFEKAFEKSVIVNLPAQVYSNVTNWINKNNLIDLGAENSITFVKWFVCTGGVDSINFFLQSLDDFGHQMTHVFVKNMGLCDDWNYIQEMSEFIKARSEYDFIIMDFPKFPYWERNIIDRWGLSFSKSLANSEIKVVSKQRIKNFLKTAYAAFAVTDLIK